MPQVQTCARKRSVAFTPLARQDFDDVLLYSLITWGRDQAALYESQLDRSITQIKEHPDIGRPFPKVLPRCRNHRSGQHAVYYTVSNDTVIILHSARAASRHTVDDGHSGGVKPLAL